MTRPSGPIAARIASGASHILKAGSLVPAEQDTGRVAVSEIGLFEAGPARMCGKCETCSEQMLMLLGAIGDGLAETAEIRNCKILSDWFDKRADRLAADGGRGWPMGASDKKRIGGGHRIPAKWDDISH